MRLFRGPSLICGTQSYNKTVNAFFWEYKKKRNNFSCSLYMEHSIWNSGRFFLRLVRCLSSMIFRKIVLCVWSIRTVNTQDNSIKVKVFFLSFLHKHFRCMPTKETPHHYGKCNEEKDESNWTKPLENIFFNIIANCGWLGRACTSIIIKTVFLQPYTQYRLMYT